jgi:DNA-binding response OmpR family regulator
MENTGKIKILFVEDEPFLGRIVKESLESREFIVKMVTDGKDALQAYQDFSPDVAVLDVMLPSRDGYSIAGDIRQINSSVPIIFVTAKIQTEDVVKGFHSGGNDYIRKPFSMEELIVRIQHVVSYKRQPKALVDDIIKIGKYEFNTVGYELRYEAQARKLSHRESTLLQLFVQHKNATVLRKEILLKLWGDDSFFNSRNLDVYVTKLRDYLKNDTSIKIITIKGIGYQFTVQ